MSRELFNINLPSFSFENGKDVLKNISFSINEGEILGISGESGCGKTTLAKIIAGIYKSDTINIIFNEQIVNSNSGSSTVQLLFQNNGEILNPLRKIRDVIDEAVQITNKKNSGKAIKPEDILISVGLGSELWNRKGFELSGGEQQRAALARLLAVNPKLLILDEPFSAQDIQSQINFLHLFKKINQDFNITIICISHDLKLLRKLANRILIMKDGEIIESGDTNETFNNPKQEYTKFLLKAESYSLTLKELHTD